MPRPHPLVIGHRGAPGYRPEHTRGSYALAIAMGVDAVEPDVVVARDGVLVVRHENELSGTTDVADRAEFADRRTTKVVDGHRRDGWFTEDFTWAELQTLRCREPWPDIRPTSAGFDDEEGMLRLADVLELAAAAPGVGVVVEVKHSTYFTGLGWDVAALLAADLAQAGGDGDRPLTIESFEPTVLMRLREYGVAASYIFLLEASGRPFDLVAAGGDAPPYAFFASPEGLDAMSGRIDGISVDKRMILGAGPGLGGSRLVVDAHDRGLQVYTWTCRPENRFLLPGFRSNGDAGAVGRYEDEWRILRDAALDGVFVDHPDLGVAFFRDA